MKIFWPHRSDAKGFAIKDLSTKYPEKISRVSFNENLNQLAKDRVLKINNKDMRNTSLYNLSIKKVHWANRDFSEYKEAA